MCINKGDRIAFHTNPYVTACDSTLSFKKPRTNKKKTHHSSKLPLNKQNTGRAAPSAAMQLAVLGTTTCGLTRRAGVPPSRTKFPHPFPPRETKQDEPACSGEYNNNLF